MCTKDLCMSSQDKDDGYLIIGGRTHTHITQMEIYRGYHWECVYVSVCVCSKKKGCFGLCVCTFACKFQVLVQLFVHVCDGVFAFVRMC